MKMRKARKGFRFTALLVKNIRHFEWEGRRWTATEWEHKHILTRKGESK